MDKAKFDINPHVIRQLGAELVSDQVTALMELIKNSYKKQVNEQEYVKLIQAHLERGMVKLYGEFATNKQVEDFIEAIL